MVTTSLYVHAPFLHKKITLGMEANDITRQGKRYVRYKLRYDNNVENDWLNKEHTIGGYCTHHYE